MHETEYTTGKESNCQAGDIGSIPRLGESPGEGNHNSLQYSWEYQQSFLGTYFMMYDNKMRR